MKKTLTSIRNEMVPALVLFVTIASLAGCSLTDQAAQSDDGA